MEVTVLKIIHIKRQQGETGLAASVTNVMNSFEGATLIAVVPTMLAFFAMSPERYEVSEADVILEVPSA